MLTQRHGRLIGTAPQRVESVLARPSGLEACRGGWSLNRHKQGNRGPLFAFGGSSSLIRVVDCTNQSKSGDGLHEAQSIRPVWSCGGAAYRNGGANAFSRDAFRRRRWQFEVLRQRRNLKSVLNVLAFSLSPVHFSAK